MFVAGLKIAWTIMQQPGTEVTIRLLLGLIINKARGFCSTDFFAFNAQSNFFGFIVGILSRVKYQEMNVLLMEIEAGTW